MCGFAGFFGFSVLDCVEELERMGTALEHRGPDSSGTWKDENNAIGLVHRRLSVVDLSSAGSQPMISASGRYVICFNGEVYNHLEIRNQLEAHDPSLCWRGTSDTETILAAIERHGLEKAIVDWVGMFAFALWDRDQKKLYLGRDRFGEKPIYYGWYENRFLFASELKAISATHNFQANIDPHVLALFFRHHYVPAPYSIYEKIFKLGAGEIAEFSPGDSDVKLTTYWSALDVAHTQSTQPFTGTYDEAVDGVEKILINTIRDQSIADVPVGAFLSGGIDSSLIVSIMQQHANSTVKTFSIGFGNEKFNEAVYAKRVAKHLGTEHTEYYMDAKQALDLVPELPELYDEPFADSSQLPTYMVSKIAREKVTVSLSGDGGDELFGGYTRYKKAAKAIDIRNRLGRPGSAISSMLLSSRLMRRNEIGRPTFGALPGPFGNVAENIAKAAYLTSQPSSADVYREMVSHWRVPHSPVGDVSEADYGFTRPDSWYTNGTVHEAVQLMDVQFFMVDQILVKVDRASMRCSLESRVPFLDHRLAEFVWSLPPIYRTAEKQSKPLLKSLLQRYVPNELIDRPKAGFGVPLDEWLRGPLKDWAISLIDAADVNQQGILDAKRVTEAWSSFEKGNGAVTAAHIWGILAFQSWLQQQASARKL